MTNILTTDEAARVVGEDSTAERLLDVLPQVDSYVNGATGHDWTADTAINPEAKAAARLYLALTYDLMSMQQNQIDALNRALISSLTRLEAIATELQTIQNINSTQYVEDMRTYLESGTLGLNLIAYNRLSGRQNIAQAVLNGRPFGGYTNKATIQTALDTAVKAVM